MRDLAEQFAALAEKQGATVPVMMGHRIMGSALIETGDFAEARTHLDSAIALYNPEEHRQLAMRFSGDIRGVSLGFRSLAAWLSGLSRRCTCGDKPRGQVQPRVWEISNFDAYALPNFDNPALARELSGSESANR